MKIKKPNVTVIIVARNQKDTITTCIESVLYLDYDNYEVIVVDDCSRDGTDVIIEGFPVKLIRLDKSGGPALARNCGANQANGEFLIFLDADVTITRGTVTEMVRIFQEQVMVKAVQGIYSRESAYKNIPTQYKDYFNYYKNQGIDSQSLRTIATYCFAIRRQTFFDVGKFDINIPNATVEDNDLGYKLYKSGYQVILSKRSIVTHLKKYSLKSLLKRDYIVSFHMIKFILRIIHARKKNERLKNILVIPLKSGKRTSTCIAVSLILSCMSFVAGVSIFIFKNPSLYLISFLLISVFFLVNLRYFLLLSKIKGWLFCFIWMGIFYLDMLFSSLGLFHGAVDFLLFQREY